MGSFFVYIIYSKSTDRYYIGQTEDLGERLSMHNSHFFTHSFTKIASDWELKYALTCRSRSQALRIESHIKKNKSRKYIEDVIRHESIGLRLLEKYQNPQ
ncbi:GIY-YIG nuclease family protein [Algoriphagus sp. H41]|uniref:GIY-YIG nuclease family protein n=1 Tax=Algoriphagus oliviformis TaxID=2811231 RepID=A0ABS3C172_9BACT|nr:GIY-YIG nuclease family protein [Algoriphagus oliviformis]MBN7810853.1 GIY-YIG nuclease family protein [Algoriphagus oliviformis]